MFAKITVTGPEKHPLYAALISAKPDAEFKPDSDLMRRLPSRQSDPSEVHWNFEKFLLDRNGSVIGRFAPDIEPQDKIVVDAIDLALST